MSLGEGAGKGVGTGGGTGDGGGNSSGSAGGTGASAGNSSSGSSGAGTGPAAGGAGGNGAGPAAGGMGPGASGEGKSWRDQLPDDIKADPTLNKYSDLTNLAKAHIDLQKKIGQKGIFKPAPGASPEQIKAFREELGIPTDPTKYDMGKFEGVEIPDVTVQWAQKLGAEHGIEPAAMKTLMTEYFKLDSQNQAAAALASKEAVKAGYEGLRKEWGDAFDRNLTRANFAAQKLGGQALVDKLTKLGAADDPVILKAFSDAAKLFGEDSLREAGAGDGRETPQELDAQIQQVQAEMFKLKPTDGAYPGLKQRYESLWKRKTGGK